MVDLKDLISQSLKARAEKRRVDRVRRAKRTKRKFPLEGLARAQAWSLQHFNANRPAEENTPLNKPSFQVTFEGDKMTVSPRLYGRPLEVSIEYIYSGTPIGDCWLGRNPLTGLALPILWVQGVFFEKDDKPSKEV